MRVGFYGKLPDVGDFVQRQLPVAFIQPWERWLCESLVTSQSQLGAQWLETYLICPVWHFVLAAGVLNQSAWAGVLMPSVDRVGRYFPLTIASPLAAADDCCQTLTAAATWLTQAETVARFGLQLDCTLAQFIAQVLALPPCPTLPQSSLAQRGVSCCWHAAGVTLSYPELPPPAQFERLLRGGSSLLPVTDHWQLDQ